MKKIFQILIIILICISAIYFYSCKDDTVTSEEPVTTEPTVYDEEPSWSNDGNWIAYVGGDNTNGFKVNAIDINSGNKRFLTQVSAQSPLWVKNDEWIVYEKNGNIFKKRINGDTVTIQLTFTGNCFFPSVSKDGNWIAFDSNIGNPGNFYCVWKIKIDGTEKKRINYDSTQGEVRQPDWFPDGIRLAVSRYFVNHGGAREIAIIDTAGNSIATLTNNTEIDRLPRVSPDGQYIVWWKDLKVFTIKTDGSQLTQIAINAINPYWSPDGTKIVYTNVTHDDGRIWMMNKDGTGRRKITY